MTLDAIETECRELGRRVAKGEIGMSVVLAKIQQYAAALPGLEKSRTVERLTRLAVDSAVRNGAEAIGQRA